MRGPVAGGMTVVLRVSLVRLVGHMTSLGFSGTVPAAFDSRSLCANGLRLLYCRGCVG